MKKKKEQKPLAQHFAAALGLIMSSVSTAAMTPICAVLANSWYLCRKQAQSSYKAVSCTEAVGGSASDLMVTAVCLQTGFGQSGNILTCDVRPTLSSASYSCVTLGFFSLLYLSCLFSLSGSSQEQRLYLTLCLYSAYNNRAPGFLRSQRCCCNASCKC